MINTKVVFNLGLCEPIHIYDGLRDIPEALEIFRAGQILIIDNLRWIADIELIRAGLENVDQETLKNVKGQPPRWASKDPSPEVARELEKLRSEIDLLFSGIYPSLRPSVRRESFRPMIVRNATMHYDHYDGEVIVTSYMNIARTPRVYRIGRSFPGIVKDQPEVMDEIARECRANLGAVSRAISERTKRNKAPLGGGPTHRVELAPESIWFFDAKMVSHQVVYGEGVVGRSWEVPGAAKTQRQYLGMN